MDFRKYIREKINKTDHIIEFGPLNRPLFTKDEFKNIYYADIRSTEEIKKLYSGNDYLKKTGINIDINTIVDVDYKIIGSYKNTFKGKKFNIAYLSHVVEHMPSIVDFFKDIYEILEDDGLLVLIYPDKRYCFDHFRNEVSFRDAYATYKYGIKENARIAFDFAYNVITENNAYKFWHDKSFIDKISKAKLDEGEKYYQDILDGKNIDDVHFWPFSDYGFLKFIYEMQRAKLLNFTIEEFHPTEDSTQEFLIILKKDNSNDTIKTLQLLKTEDQFFINQKIISNLENEKEKCKQENIELQEKYNAEKKINENYEIELKNTIKEANNNYQKYEEQIQNMQKTIADLNDTIISIYNSSSMKITKPLRKIKGFFITKR